jgi:hypothetical protein
MRIALLVVFAAVLVFPAGVFARGAGHTDTGKTAVAKAGQERAAAPMKPDEAPEGNRALLRRSSREGTSSPPGRSRSIRRRASSSEARLTNPRNGSSTIWKPF